jgi:hydroxyacyl-ACP dehydratase HTD2-like protein with hotdog domain
MDWSRILHGGEEIELRRPIYVGDRLHVGQRVADIYVKEGRSGIMDFLVLEAVAKDDGGEVVYTVKRTVVVKRRAEGAAP